MVHTLWEKMGLSGILQGTLAGSWPRRYGSRHYSAKTGYSPQTGTLTTTLTSTFFPVLIWVVITVLSGCSEKGSKACIFNQPDPYSDHSPYLGIHGNRENSDRVYCHTSKDLREDWHALEGTLMFQPFSFAADGKNILVTVPKVVGCKLYSIRTIDGGIDWCKEDVTLGVVAGAVEADLNGDLYFTDGMTEAGVVRSLEADGTNRWETSLEDLISDGRSRASIRAPAGVHFTPEGYIATATVDGVVVLLDRSDGRILASFDIPASTGFRSGPTAEVAMNLIPGYLKKKLSQLVGAVSDQDFETVMAASFGRSGAFSDNTIAVSVNNQLFLVGGGPDDEHGSLVALDISGQPGKPVLTLRWTSLFLNGSATSPSITPKGDKLVLGDGASNLVYIDVRKCNENLDAHADPKICLPSWLYRMTGSPILGSVAIDEDGSVFAWNQTSDATAADLFKLSDGGDHPVVLWAANYTSSEGYNRVWTSPATVTDNLVWGTLTEVRDTLAVIESLPLITDLSHELVAVDRITGKIAARYPIPDDGVITVIPGPDGSIYVPMMGMLDLLSPSPDIGVSGGILRFVPRG